MSEAGAGLAASLVRLRDELAGVAYPLPLPDAATDAALARASVGQLDDYLIPRLARLDAPLLAVAGGSTGAGKSTLVNSLVQAPVSVAGARRPTTRAPVLVCHPGDATWFGQAQLLPRLGRTHTPGGPGTDLVIVTSAALTPGLALLDAPDIDSVEEANRALAEQLLAAADLWLFVTTAVRYADAVPWELLTTARERGTAVAVVLNRVPSGADDEVVPHLREMLAEHGLGEIGLYVVAERRLDEQGLLPPEAVAPLRDWLDQLARSAAERARVIRQTVDGAVAALVPATDRLAAGADGQAAAVGELREAAERAYRDAELTVDHGLRDGVLFRGEVLTRWQELVGTGEFMRGLQARVGRWRDRIVAAVSGKPMPDEQLKTALESGLVTFLHGTAADAAEQAVTAWRTRPAGAAVLAAPGGPELAAPSPDLPDRADRLVRDWQRGVLELVRTESGNRLFAAKASAYAVNALGLCLMVATFAATAFIPTGAEIAVAGGTTIAAQKVLEAVFGDQAVRRLAEQARQDLLARVRTLYGEEARRFHAVLAAVGVDPDAGQRLRAAASAVRAARQADPVPGGAA
ncbi:GTPase domain-containing protein [Catellatospora sp. KI3]|uniref:GTPase domain-containing protein n=1 Tax=Catellatospora sp. KI3 TaxID=3041620 RepID=UPI002482CE55|nr:GTPase domain-containing protein [Catellatospora sp. KI3]MDI1462972.1 GTPase domain-containing protein [Catellatospora sp. KI3]